MSIALKVESLSKSFRLHKKRPRTLRESISRRIKGETIPDAVLWALHDVSFEVGKGQTIGMIGRNGAGKSTLLRLLCGIGRPTSGKIIRDGSISGLLELGAGFHQFMTGRENIRTAGILNGLTSRQVEKLEKEMIEFAELEEFIDEPVRTYSSGMYLRLAFSSVIHLQPDILVIDEVLAVGDLAFREKCLNRMSDFRRTGRTMIVASHDMEQLKMICDEAIVLDDGRISFRSLPDQAIEHYEELLRTRTEKRAMQLSIPVVPTQQPDRGNRMGTQEASISSVRVLDEGGRPIETLQTGKDLIVEIEVVPTSHISDFVLSLAIFTEKDVSCFETIIPSIKSRFGVQNGTGRFQCRIRSLPLLPGHYYLNVGVYPLNWEFIYDYHWQMHSIQIVGEVPNIQGIISLQPDWSQM